MSERIKHGTVREDGMIFWSYQKDKERWLTPEKFEEDRLKRNERTNLIAA